MQWAVGVVVFEITFDKLFFFIVDNSLYELSPKVSELKNLLQLLMKPDAATIKGCQKVYKGTEKAKNTSQMAKH